MKKRSLKNKLSLTVKDLSSLAGKEMQQAKGGAFFSNGTCYTQARGCIATEGSYCATNCYPYQCM